MKAHHCPNRPIAFFLPMLNGGGAQRVVLNLANTLPHLTQQPVHIVLARKQGVFVSDVSPQVEIIDLNSNRTALSIFKLARYLRKEKPMALMTSMHYVNIIGTLAWLLAGRPGRLVIREASVWRPPIDENNNVAMKVILEFLMKRSYRFANVLVANSQDTLDSLKRASIRLPHCCRVIGNPVVVETKTASQEDDPMADAFPMPYVCAIGRLEFAKGFDVLLEAFSRISNKTINLVILGEGSQRNKLEKHARSLGIDRRVFMPGFVASPQTILRNASLFVLSSRWEGFGNVLVEALSMGVPIVSTDCPGAPGFILENGRYGALVPVEDHEALAEKIEQSMIRPVGHPQARIARANEFSATVVARRYLKETLLPER
jgi:glycosyltransferase involved in cell wall biosynthesis